MKLNDFFKRNSVGMKMFALYFLGMSVTVMAMGYFSYNKSKEIIYENVSVSALQTIQQANRRLDLVLEEYANRSQLVFSNKGIQKGILADFEDTYAHRSNTQETRDFLSNLVNAKNDTQRIYILGERRASFRYNMDGLAELPPVGESTQQEGWYKRIKEANGKPVWFGVMPSPLPPRIGSDNVPVFALGRAIKHLDGRNEIIGVLLMEFDPSYIRSFLNGIEFQEGGTILLVGPDHKVVSGEGGVLRFPEGLLREGDPNGVLRITLNGERMFTVYDKSGVNDWRLVGMVPERALVRDASAIGHFTIALVVGFMFVSIVLAFIAAKQMFDPVKRLLRSMQRVREGDFSIQILEPRRDEFGILFFGFNVMVQRIKSLIDEVYVQQLLKQESQLKMMSSQINAHFLYNTLDSIHWISRLHKVDEISAMIFGLSKYLRISLSEGRDFVTVKEVAELLDSYLLIQKVRYGDKFTVAMTIDPSLEYEHVLKYVFQPIVENAIYHGLEKKRGQGRLTITWTREGQMSHFTVEDDGVGIPAGKLADIQVALARGEASGGGNFALINIAGQIRLAYDGSAALTVESREGEGTKVTLAMPLGDRNKQKFHTQSKGFHIF